MYGQEPVLASHAIAAASKTARTLSLEEFRGAIEHESDLSLLSILRDQLNSRCRKLEQEACNKERETTKRRYTSMSESDSDDASTCSTVADKRRCTSMSESDSDDASTCITMADKRRCTSMSESDSDAAPTCITMAGTSTEVATKADPLTSIQNLPTVWDFGLFGPRSSMNLKGRSIGRELGRGRFATVFSTSQVGRNEALKVISKKEVDAADDWTNIANEYDALSNLGPHPNIVCLTEAVQSSERIYFFMDLAEGQDLFDFIKSRKQSPVAEEAIQLISKSILSALAHCHGQGTCHRDVKPENIIVQKDYSAKLVDFGCACPRYQPQGPRCIGTVPFIAPECLNGQSVDAAPADVWSFGSVVLEMTFGLNALSRFLGWKTYALPAFGECGGELTTLFADPSRALDQIRSKLGANVASEGDEVLARMLHADPSQRPSAEALL